MEGPRESYPIALPGYAAGLRIANLQPVRPADYYPAFPLCLRRPARSSGGQEPGK
jgi:hypothetical protein